jgi:hypothetical protein
MKVFLMLVFCSPVHSTCDVQWSTAIYPNVEECSYVAPSWLKTTREWGWGPKNRKPDGVFCEVGKAPPKAYTTKREAFE